jgi:hypothetical protein
MKRRILVVAMIVAVAIAAVSLVGKKTDVLYTRADADHDLSAARTAAEELAAFDRIARRTRVVFGLYDAVGEQLGMSTSDWPNRAHSIRFHQFGDPPLDHTIIERKNISTLMRE